MLLAHIYCIVKNGLHKTTRHGTMIAVTVHLEAIISICKLNYGSFSVQSLFVLYFYPLQIFVHYNIAASGGPYEEFLKLKRKILKKGKILEALW